MLTGIMGLTEKLPVMIDQLDRCQKALPDFTQCCVCVCVRVCERVCECVCVCECECECVWTGIMGLTEKLPVMIDQLDRCQKALSDFTQCCVCVCVRVCEYVSVCECVSA